MTKKAWDGTWQKRIPKPEFKTPMERELYEALWLVWNRWNVMDGPGSKEINRRVKEAFARAEGKHADASE